MEGRFTPECVTNELFTKDFMLAMVIPSSSSLRTPVKRRKSNLLCYNLIDFHIPNSQFGNPPSPASGHFLSNHQLYHYHQDLPQYWQNRQIITSTNILQPLSSAAFWGRYWLFSHLRGEGDLSLGCSSKLHHKLSRTDSTFGSQDQDIVFDSLRIDS
jgi:hypothetical protein